MSKTDACKLTLNDDTHYDLSSLANPRVDYEVSVGESTYKLNPCRNVVSELWHLPDGTDSNVAGFVRGNNGDFSIGSSTNSSLQLGSDGKNVVLYLEKGSPCGKGEGSQLASTAIKFICEPAEFGTGKVNLVAALPASEPNEACAFFFEWKTHVACATNKPLKVGEHWSYIAAFFALLLIAGLAALIGGTMYNRFILGHRGLHQIPKPSMPSLKNPFKRQQGSVGLGGTTGSGPSGSGRSWNPFRRNHSRFTGYNHIRADDNDEEDHLAGRFSLEDDEIEEDARDLANDASQWREVRSGGLNSGNAVNGRQASGLVAL